MQIESRPRRFDDRGKNRKHKLSPLVGESVSEAGKCEQKRKDSLLQTSIKYLPVIIERS